MSESNDTTLSDADDARIESILRSLTDEDHALLDPPDSVWAGIEAGARPDHAADHVAEVIDLRSRRRTAILAGAAAAALILVVAVGAILTSGSDDPQFEVVSVAELVWDADAFDPAGEGRSASAELLEDGEALFVRVDDSDLPAPDADADLEIWLIGFDTGNDPVIQTLGLVDDPDDPGVFAVPAEFGTAGFDTVAVDISIEPRDGVETHSGRSIVRGDLSA